MKGTAEHCCICIPCRACVECFDDLLRPVTSEYLSICAKIVTDIWKELGREEKPNECSDSNVSGVSRISSDEMTDDDECHCEGQAFFRCLTRLPLGGRRPFSKLWVPPLDGTPRSGLGQVLLLANSGCLLCLPPLPRPCANPATSPPPMGKESHGEGSSLVEPRLNFCLHLHLGSFSVFVCLSMDGHDMQLGRTLDPNQPRAATAEEQLAAQAREV